MRRRMALGLLSAGCLLLVAALGWAGARGAGTECVLGSYGTSLRGRTRAQVFNALRAAQSLDGAVLQPGETFSFNKRVGPWNAAAGYRKAPVSFDGEMVPSYGGGVCQTSTTLYNAAMLAGLEIVERHRHVRPPAYVAPGRDAAVAMPGVDLRIRNPYPYPVRIQARNIGESLIVTVHGRGPRRPHRPPHRGGERRPALARARSGDVEARDPGIHGAHLPPGRRARGGLLPPLLPRR